VSWVADVGVFRTLIVTDGGLDRSNVAGFTTEYAKRDSRIRLVSSFGIINALTGPGTGAAGGFTCAYMDADDIYLPGDWI